MKRELGFFLHCKVSDYKTTLFFNKTYKNYFIPITQAATTTAVN